MPKEFDWRDLPTADHQGTDPLSRFTPEVKPPAQRSQQPLPPPQKTHKQPRRSRPSWRASKVVVLVTFVSGLAFAAAYVWSDRAHRTSQDSAPAIVFPDASATSTDTAALPTDASKPDAGAPPAASSTKGPTALPLDVDGGAFSPSFDSTGSTLFFHVGRLPVGRLARTELDGDSPTAIVMIGASSGRNYHVRLSPDGRQIAYDSDRYGLRAVYVAQADGTIARRVSGPGYAELPSWSPDGKFLAFVRGEPSRPKVWNLWVRNMRTWGLGRLTTFRSGQTWTASWFPDSRRLAFTHDDQLTVLDITNGRTQTFRSPTRGSAVRTPAVSPDGLRVIFQVTGDGAWLLDMRTGAMQSFLDDPTAEEFAWTPQGNRVAYHSHRDGAWRIWIASVPS